MNVEHETIRTERDYPHPPARVFAAWSDAEVKRRWFDLSDTLHGEWHSDFRVGGAESYRSAPGVGPVLTYDAVHRDIVRDERILITSEITTDGRRASVTLTTVELEPIITGTRVRITDQAAFLDGLESSLDRRRGTAAQLDRLEVLLSDRPDQPPTTEEEPE